MSAATDGAGEARDSTPRAATGGGPAALTVDQVRALVAERRRQHRAIVAAFAFASAAERGDVEASARLSLEVSDAGVWPSALRAVTRLSQVPAKVRRRWVSIWRDRGDDIRDETGDDTLLTDALRLLLPPYKGGPLTLYRGDSAFNRRRRTYGLSWSVRESVADEFATGMWRTCVGGSVVVRTVAPAEAVIAVMPRRSDSYREAEVIVDRRKLRRVEVVRRYDQVIQPWPAAAPSPCS